MVVAIGPAELDALVRSTNRNETFKKLHEEAVMSGNGSA